MPWLSTRAATSRTSNETPSKPVSLASEIASGSVRPLMPIAPGPSVVNITSPMPRVWLRRLERSRSTTIFIARQPTGSDDSGSGDRAQRRRGRFRRDRRFERVLRQDHGPALGGGQVGAEGELEGPGAVLERRQTGCAVLDHVDEVADLLGKGVGRLVRA